MHVPIILASAIEQRVLSDVAVCREHFIAWILCNVYTLPFNSVDGKNGNLNSWAVN